MSDEFLLRILKAVLKESEMTSEVDRKKFRNEFCSSLDSTELAKFILFLKVALDNSVSTQPYIECQDITVEFDKTKN